MIRPSNLIGLITRTIFAVSLLVGNFLNVAAVCAENFKALKNEQPQPIGGHNQGFVTRVTVGKYVEIITKQPTLRVALVTVKQDIDSLICLIVDNAELFNGLVNKKLDDCTRDEFLFIEKYRSVVSTLRENLLALFNALVKVHNTRSSFERSLATKGLSSIIEICLVLHGRDASTVKQKEPFYLAMSSLEKPSEITALLLRFTESEVSNQSALGRPKELLALAKNAISLITDTNAHPQLKDLMASSKPPKGRSLQSFMDNNPITAN